MRYLLILLLMLLPSVCFGWTTLGSSISSSARLGKLYSGQDGTGTLIFTSQVFTTESINQYSSPYQNCGNEYSGSARAYTSTGTYIANRNTLIKDGYSYRFWRSTTGALYIQEEISSCAPTWSPNGVKDGDEDGVDCGGTTGQTCSNVCPSGSAYGVGPTGQVGCIADAVPSDSFGNCKTGWSVFTFGGSKYCTKAVEPVWGWANAEWEAPGIESGELQGGTLSIVTTAPEINNTPSPSAPPGTASQTTVTTTVTNNSTNTTTTTTTTSYWSGTNGTGEKLGEETQEELAAEDDPGNYDFSLGSVPENVYNSDLEADTPEESDISSLLTDFMSQSPLFAAINNLTVDTSNSVCSVTTATPVFGSFITIDLCPWEEYLESLGIILTILAQGYALLIVYRGWK